MCNIYKNNLIILSQLEKDQLIYIKEETNQLKLENRYLTYLRNGTDEAKIGDIINTSFLAITNNYLLNISYNETIHNENLQQDLTLSLEDNIKEIKNTKELLTNSLKGLQTYEATLFTNNHNYNDIMELNINLHAILDNIDIYRENYIKTINPNSNKTNHSNSWLYNLYQNTFSSKSVITHLSKPITELKIKELVVETIEEEIVEEEPNCDSNTEDSYLFGLVYIVTRKIGNFFISIGSHLRYILGRH